MKSIWVVCFLIVGLAFVGCTSATYPVQGLKGLNRLSNEEIDAYNNDPNNTDKIVCRKERQTGHRIPKRVCRKQSVIDEIARQSQDSIRSIQSRGAIGSSKE